MLKLGTTAIAFLLLQAGSACAADNQRRGDSCEVTSLEELASSPLRFAGKRYCGKAFILKRSRSIYIVSGSNKQPSDDLSLLVTTASSRLLGPLNVRPKRYYIEASVDPMAECFAPPSDNGEECSPYRRPVFFDLEVARRR